MAVLVFYGEGLYFKDSQNKLTNETEATIRSLLLENNGVGIIGGYYDKSLPICMVSELAVSTLGYDSITEFEKLTEEDFLNIICAKNDVPMTEERFAELSGATRMHLYTKTGSAVCVRMVKCDLRLADGKKMWLLSICNIDEVYKREQMLIAARDDAERANQSKTYFLSRMSHDMRTPMNGIMGMVKIALDNLDDKAVVKDSLEKIRNVGKELEMLVSDVLDMSRLESGKIKLLHEPFDIRDEVKKIEFVLYSQAQELVLRGGHVDVKHNYVLGSSLHIQRIWENVIGNAIKYTKAGGSIEYWLQELNIDKKHGLYRFIVKDTGIGMSEDFQKHMFEPYLQENVNAEIQGTGLGLAITKELVELMGGTIKVKSKLGVGTTFRIDIPLEIDYTAMHRLEEAEAVRYNLQGVSVLLAEDNALNREIARYILAQAGATVEQAEDGEQAVQKFLTAKPGTYQLVLMDIQMPKMDGLKATELIRHSEHTQAKDIPIIAMTANAFAEDVQKSLDAGMNGHLVKPIDIDKLLRIVQDYGKRVY